MLTKSNTAKDDPNRAAAKTAECDRPRLDATLLERAKLRRESDLPRCKKSSTDAELPK